MLFSSPEFLFVFLPAVLVGYFVVLRKSRKLQNVFLTVCSLFFYAYGEPWFVFVMMGSILANWAFALWLHRLRHEKAKAKGVIVLMLAVNLGIIFIFKYLAFTVVNLNSLLGSGLTVPKIALPIGISFFTFQAISYVIDVYRGNGQVQKNPMNVALYISFFPQLIAGPIVRYQTIAQQIENRKETVSLFSKGVCRFIIGLGKKMILANNFALVADVAFGATGQLSVLAAWGGALAYTFQIFYDFSGYSDMAIGLGSMFGFTFLENFNYPYISRTVSEFWRRWHISLGTFFRDYVYIPLGGSRVKTKAHLVFNLFCVWFLTGVWHGANWTFITWGLLYFVLLTAEKLLGKDKGKSLFGWAYTMFFVVVGWVIFRAADLSQAWAYIGNMFGSGGTVADGMGLFFLGENAVFFGSAVLFSMPVGTWLAQKTKGLRWAKVLYPVGICLILLISISYMVKNAYNPFIYFNF